MILPPLSRVIALVGCAALATLNSHAAERFDVVLHGGRIVDGTGAPWYVADVGIRDGRIAAIGRLGGRPADDRVDVDGLVVAPGFVDMMGQTATPFLDDPSSALNVLTQGITTINAGEGASAAPLGDAMVPATERRWSTMAGYFQMLDMKGLPLNVVQTVGHTQVRRIVLGDKDVRPDADQLVAMQALVREAMEAGAIGVSTALIYPPAVYADADEIAALAQVAGEYGGRYYTHMRNEGDRLLEAIDEAIAIGEKGGVPVHIFHLKAAGRANWGKMEQAIARIKAARSQGREVTADMYPYINNGLGIAALVHPRHFSDGRAALLKRLDDPGLRTEIRDEMENEAGWENWFRHIGKDWEKLVLGRIDDEKYAPQSGQSLAAIARKHGEDPWETFFQLVKAGAFALPQSMAEANKIRLMKEEFISFCTDFGPNGGDRVSSHPRAFGAFPRLFSHYVRDLGVLSLERAVAQASAAGANNVMVRDRGRIAVGLAADIIVFDERAIADHAVFANPHALSTGMHHVLVNGRFVLREGRMTQARSGTVLRGPGFRPDTASARVSTGKADARMASLDATMQDFLAEHRVAGAALAVVDEGRLVYARGYGYADIGKREQVRPESLFRIASISKPITAVTVMKLAEEGKLGLDDRVFDILPFEPYSEEEDTPIDGRQREITLRQLLQHRGGWDRNASFDPMFQAVRFAHALGVEPPAGSGDVIRVMSGRPLDFAPGQRYVYSNYGYCLLGRVIEKITGKPYDAAVRERVLDPLGIRTMRLGRTLAADQATGEVRYYDPGRGSSVFAANLGQRVPAPYGAWNVEAMDSHGGWLGSVLDLARFAAAFSDPWHHPLLGDGSVEEMFAKPAAGAGDSERNFYYSCGWLNREVEGGINRWHTGSLPGTAALLVLRHDRRAWVVLFNTRVSPVAPHLGRAIDPLMHRAVDAVKEWPDVNLFEENQF